MDRQKIAHSASDDMEKRRNCDQGLVIRSGANIVICLIILVIFLNFAFGSKQPADCWVSPVSDKCSDVRLDTPDEINIGEQWRTWFTIGVVRKVLDFLFLAGAWWPVCFKSA